MLVQIISREARVG